MKNEKGKWLFLIGLVLLIIAFFLPTEILSDFTELKPIGLASIFFCPLLGVAGLVFSIRARQKTFIVLNSLLIAAFPILMHFAQIFALFQP